MAGRLCAGRLTLDDHPEPGPSDGVLFQNSSEKCQGYWALFLHRQIRTTRIFCFQGHCTLQQIGSFITDGKTLRTLGVCLPLQKPLTSKFLHFRTNKIYVIIGISSVFFIIIIILVTILCVQRGRRSPRPRAKGYIAGRKQSSGSGRQQPPDFWIVNGQGAARPAGAECEGTVLRDFRHCDVAVDSPPPRYQTVQGRSIFHIFYEVHFFLLFSTLFFLCFLLFSLNFQVSPLMTQSQLSPSSLLPLRHSLRKLHRQSLPPALSYATKRVCEPPYSGAEDSDSAIAGSRTSSRNGLQPPPPTHKRSALKRLNSTREGSSGNAGTGTGSSAYVSDADSKSNTWIAEARVQ